MNEADPIQVIELAKRAVMSLADCDASPAVKTAALRTAAEAVQAADIAQQAAVAFAAAFRPRPQR